MDPPSFSNRSCSLRQQGPSNRSTGPHAMCRCSMIRDTDLSLLCLVLAALERVGPKRGGVLVGVFAVALINK